MTEIVIHLEFNDHVAVTLYRNDQDKVSFKMLHPDKFLGTKSGKTIRHSTIGALAVLENLPKQITSGQAEKVDAISESQTELFRVLFSGNIFLSIVMSLSLNQLIGFLNAV